MITAFFPMLEWADDDRQDTLRWRSKLRSRNSLAMSHLAAGRTAKAIRLYERTLADSEQVLGADDQNTLRSRNNLAMSYRAAGRTAEAIPLLERALADCERVLGARHPDTKVARENLAALTGKPERHRPYGRT
jgi:tetratricopeptide (TPR) repeat protein